MQPEQPGREATPWLELPLTFDHDALGADLKVALRHQWHRHYNDRDHRGNWSGVALRSASGSSSDIHAGEHQRFVDTALLAHSPALRSAIDRFPCEKQSVRLLALGPGATILPHRDAGGALEDGLVRLHIPIHTDPAVLFFIEGQAVHFGAGACWYLNTNCEHAVRNDSQVTRVHLILDCLVNDWLRDLFTQAGWQPRRASRYGDPSINDANVDAVIAALQAGGSPAALALAASLRQQRDLALHGEP